ncbi:E3 ubiquitin-protein ligase RNF34 isoform X2 [Rhipicephalus microplus]|uniref:E3 ubiquitin-protein ligase RNF34 isoform X2 n=1 Tax=Rhipicephalus microplus TaxID=6941 RepID=UPI003F6CC4D0
MGAPAFMKEFREFMNFNSDGGLFGGSTQSRLGSCDSCLTKFGLLKRRHACDQCGTDFCAACVRGRRCPRCRALAGGRPALLALRPRDLRALLRARGLAPPLGAREKGELVDLLLLESTPRPEPIPEPAESSSSDSRNDAGMSPQSSVPRYEMALEHFESVDELGQLTVMQMKLMLTRNFVDYRGCCEKAELLEKLSWLWQQKRKHQGDALCEEDMCKICMEGCVDCVILDCGHMCTCTGCGKQLSECPICRQFVVRVVHVFRA